MNFILTEKKIIERPPITFGYGEPGVGKTTFAASAPDPLFLCLERGAEQLPVRRIRIANCDGDRDPETYDEILEILTGLKMTSGSLVIDTVDELERIVFAHVAARAQKPFALIPYGRGYDAAVDAIRMLLARLERIKDAGVHIILLAHSKLETFVNPEGADFNFWDLKLHKRLAGLFVAWADNVLFMRREQYALEEKESAKGKVRGVGTNARFIHTQKTPAFVAKNRYNLPDKLPLSWQDYEQAMREARPADPQELLLAAHELLEQLPTDVREKASEALGKISTIDAVALAKFVDHARARVNTVGVTAS